MKIYTKVNIDKRRFGLLVKLYISTLLQMGLKSSLYSVECKFG